MWDSAREPLGVIALNPSTADAERDDPTVRRCVAFARRWGFGGIVLTNLFAYRATSPAELVGVEEPVGRANDRHITVLIARVARVLAAWGERGSLLRRDEHVLGLLAATETWCLGLTRSGRPRHPLYVPGDTTPLRYEPVRPRRHGGSSRRASSPAREARRDGLPRRRR